MKIRTPYYYKDFKCIAGACTDTCCAGWDVDVDEASYKYYKSVKGEFGKRLKNVMVPSDEGGCTFTLTSDKRCPFLNNKNLCDLYTELGEEHLCETCDEFPRFINEYGSVREIGIAPSCITAGQLMFASREKMHFHEKEDGKLPTEYNDIDAFLYMQLCRARELAFEIIDNSDFSVDEVCVILLEMARDIQRCMDKERDDEIASVVNRFKDAEYCGKRVGKVRAKHEAVNYEYNHKNLKNMSEFFKPFKGMEVINPDWLEYVALEQEFEKALPGTDRACDRTKIKSDENYMKFGRDTVDEKFSEILAEFRIYSAPWDYRFRQLLDYYIYRYFLDAVYDINLVLKIKNMVVGYLSVRQLCVTKYYVAKREVQSLTDLALTDEEQRKKASDSRCDEYVTFDEFVDIAHLYSRQFEHSYTNFEAYSEFFMKKRCYSVSALEGLLLSEPLKVKWMPEPGGMFAGLRFDDKKVKDSGVEAKIYVMNVGRMFDSDRLYRKCMECVSDERRRKAERLKNHKDRCRSVGAGLLLEYATDQYLSGFGFGQGFGCSSEVTVEEVIRSCEALYNEDTASEGTLKCGGTISAHKDERSGVSPSYKGDRLRARDLKIMYGDKGKPEYDWDEKLHFNVAHAGKFVVCAIANVPVGIDIEGGRKADMRVAERYFTKEECNLIKSDEDFFRIWTFKEAYGKCIGEGIVASLGVSEAESGAYIARHKLRDSAEGTAYEICVCVLP